MERITTLERPAVSPRHAALIASAPKIGATAVWLLAAPFAWMPLAVSRTHTLLTVDMPVLATLYTVAVVLGICAVAGAPFVRNRFARWTLVIAFLVGFGMNYVASSIQGESLSSHMLATFMQAVQEADHAFLSYPWHFIFGFALILVLAPFLLVQPQPELSLGPRFLLFPAAATALTFLLIGSFRGRIEEFPSPIAVPVQAFYAANESNVYLGARDPVAYSDAVRPRQRKVILIVDEGIRADYLQLNNPAFDNTPFLMSAQSTLANFGIAASYSNCSNTARMALRSGARDTDFPDPGERILRQPTIWQFARQAGYRTVYVDTWLPVRKMHSMLTYDELTYIDHRFDVPLVPYSEADDRVADLIAREVSKPERTFMFVEKIGLHSPYRRNLPPDPSYVPRAGSVPHQDLDAERAGNVRDYVVGLWWRVDRFFQRLLPAIGEHDVTVIYTSDHGQALYDRGYEATNCSGANAAKGEGLVPLFVFTTDPASRKMFQASAEQHYNRASHSDIFPTVLWLMGFDPSLVEPKYSEGLLRIPPDRKRRFFVFSPFEKEMQWVQVD